MTKKLLLTALFVCMAVLGAEAQKNVSYSSGTIKGNGNIVTQDYEVTGTLREIQTLLPQATINYMVSDKCSCKVRLDENLFEYLDIRWDDDVLRFFLGNENNGNNNYVPTEFVIDLSAPRLEVISTIGSCNFNMLSAMNGDDFDVNLVGSGDVVFKNEINMRQMDLNIVGSGDVVFEKNARVDDLRVTISGSGDFLCKHLVSKKMRGTIAGSGEAGIEAGEVEKMVAKVAGSGSFESHADVNRLDAQVSGSGDITAKVNGELIFSITGSGHINYYGDAGVKGVLLGSDKLRKLDADGKWLKGEVYSNSRDKSQKTNNNTKRE